MTYGPESLVPATYPHKPAHTSVPILGPVAARWSPVRFDVHRDLSEEDLSALLEAARWAPSSWGEQPWRFLVARRGDPHRPTMEGLLSKGNAYATRASVLVAALARSTFSRNGKANRFAAHDTGLATAALLLEATYRGLISHPVGGFDGEGLRQAFNVPEEFVPMAMIAVGWHDPRLPDEDLADREERPRHRRPLAELAFGPEFGIPILPLEQK